MTLHELDAQRPAVTIRAATEADLEDVVALDATNTGLEKRDYWRDLLSGPVGLGGPVVRHFLIAERPGGSDRFLGFIVGEVRAWEFGSQPCGWIHTIGVREDARVGGIGTALFDEICARFKGDGVKMVRTMLARDDQLNMAFFRSQGLMAGSFIELEKPID